MADDAASLLDQYYGTDPAPTLGGTPSLPPISLTRPEPPLGQPLTSKRLAALLADVDSGQGRRRAAAQHAVIG